MPDTKITALTALTAADPANDVLPIVDVSDTTMAASGTTKKISVNNILGCSGTATLASATITGDLTVDTNVLKVDSTNNRVGINNATPSYALDVLGPTTISGRVKTSGAINAFYLEDSGTTPGSLYIGTSGDTFRIITGSNVRVNVDSSGNLGLGVTPSAGGGVLQLKSGITFPATQVASSDANTLDDYEEGTFTATLKGSVSDPTTPVTATGRYTKVGRQVSVLVYFSNVTTTGASGRIEINGLPFANAAYEAISTVGFDNSATFTGAPFGVTISGGTVIYMQASQSSGAYQPVTHNSGSSRSVWANLTYTV